MGVMQSINCMNYISVCIECLAIRYNLFENKRCDLCAGDDEDRDDTMYHICA